jgi:hypothetical protein
MQRYINNFTDRNGNAIPQAVVSVYREDGTLAALYSDDGVTAQANPMRTDANGEFSFYAADGVYSITLAKNGHTARTIAGAIVFDPASVAENAAESASARVQTGLDRVATAADRVQTGQDRSATGLDRAVVAADLATTQLARDVALALSNPYDTEVAGRAAVADNQLFAVVGSGDTAAFVYRRIDAGTSTLVTSLPSKAALDGITTVYKNAPALLGNAEPLAAFAAPGADGFLYSLLAFLQDGSISSPALAAFVNARMAGVQFSAVTTEDWGGVVFAQVGADGLLYVVYGARADGSFFAPGASSGTSAGEVIHMPLLGQSNMAADDSYSPLSTSATGWGGYRFNRGIATWSSTDNPTTPAARAEPGFLLVPLTAGAVETRANALADAYKAALVGASRFSAADQTGGQHVLISFSGIGSRRLTDLGPVDSGATDPGNTHAAPGGYWPTMLDDLSRGKAAAQAAGVAYSVPCWFYDQGEAEGDNKLYFTGAVLPVSEVISGYKALAVDMAAQFDVAARAVSGQTRPVPLFVTPACAARATPTAWQQAADESLLIFLVGPRYQLPSAANASRGVGGAQTWGNFIHHNPDGHRWVGELCAKVAHRVLNEGENWQPLRVLSASKVDNTTVDVLLHIPRPPVVIDTTWLAKARGWGFSMVGGTVDAPTGRIYPVTIEQRPDGRTLRLTFAAAVPAGALLEVGFGSSCDIGSFIAASVTDGAATANGFATYDITVAGDIRAALKPLTDEGAFVANGSAPSLAYIRSVSFVGGNTVLNGEVRELRSDGSFVPFSAGDTITFGRFYSYTNVRDSDPAMSINIFASGPRAGQLYPLHNWLAQHAGISIQGA